MKLGLFSAALILAGCGDKTVSARNAIPEVVITSPASGSAATEGEDLEVVGQAGDPDDSAETLIARWTVNGEEMCTGAPESDGTTFCTFTVESDHTDIQLVVVDPSGGAGEDSITITVDATAPPVAEITTPEAGDSFAIDELVQLSGVLSDTEDDPDVLTAVWTSSLDPDFSVTATMTDTEGSIEDFTDALLPGEHALTLTVTDSAGKQGTDSVVIEIRSENEGPNCEITAPAAGSSASEGTLVTFEATVSDDSPVEDLSIEWLEDAAVLETSVSDSTGNVTYATDTLTAGPHTITLSVTDVDGESCTDDITYIVGSPPTVTIEQPTAEGRYYAGLLVELSGEAIDAQDDEEDIEIVWTSSVGDDLSELDTTVNSDGTFSSFTALSEGEHALVVTATDTTGLTSEDTVIITVGAPNTAPTCELTSPESGSMVPSGTVIFQGTANDVDEAEDALTVTFTTDTELDLGPSTSPDSDGSIVFATGALTPGTHVVSMEVMDEVEATCTRSIVLEVGGPPTVAISTPADGTTVNDGEAVTFAGTVSDEEDDDTTLTVAWTSSEDGILGSDSPSATGAVELTTDGLSVGTHTITLSATDSDGGTSSDTVSITVNGLPSAPVVQIDPDPPTSAEDLVASIVTDGTDPEGEEITYTYAWSVDGSDAGVTDATVSSSATDSGQVWEVTVTAHDEYGMGASSSAAVTVNTPPTCSIESPEASSTLPTGTVSFAATANDVDSDADTLGVTFSEATLGDLGSTSPSSTGDIDFSTDALDIGAHTVSMVVTDGVGETCSASVTFEVGGAPSVAITAPIDDSVVNDGTEVSFTGTATDDEDSDWLLGVVWTSDVDGILDTESPDPTGSLSFSSSSLTVGTHVITLSATDSDAQTGTASIELIINGLPTAPSIAITPDPAATTDDLIVDIAEPSVDPEDGDVTYTYAWTLGGSDTFYAGDTVPSSATSSGDVWAVTVTAHDEYGTGGSTTAEITVVNTAPVVGSVTLSPEEVYTNDTITATTSYTDADLDSATLSYEWTVNESIVDGETSGFLNGMTHFDKGDSVFVTVTATDADGSSEPVASAPVIVLNTAPTTHTANIDPDAPIEGEDAVVCNVGSSGTDADGDTITYSISWTVDGEDFTETETGTDDWSLAGDTVPASATSDGQEWVCTITSTDGEDSGPPHSASVTIQIDCDKDDDGWLLSSAECETIEEDVDCDETDDTINPGIDETWYDGIDSDCSGGSDYDADEDGHDIIGYEDGDDCADEDPARIDCSDGIADYLEGEPYGPVAYHSVETDSGNDRLILYGGQSYHQLNGSTNAYSLSTDEWSSVDTAGIDPGERMGHASAMDDISGKMFIFGGQMYHTLSDELLVFDTTTDTWSFAEPPSTDHTGYRPPPLTGASMVYDPVLDELHIFGGQSYHGLNNELWTYSVSTDTWTGSVYETGPFAAGMVAVFNADASDDDMRPGIAFGGQGYHKLENTGWCFDDTGFEALSITGDALPPAVGMAHALAPTFGGIVAYGGQTYHNLIGDAYLIRMVADCTIEVEILEAGDDAPPQTVGSAMAWSADDAEAFLIGGQSFYELSDRVTGITP